MKKSIYLSITFLLVFTGYSLAQNTQATDTTRMGNKDSLNLDKKIVPETDRKEQMVLYTGDDLVQDSFKGSWPMFGSGLRMKIGGYVKTDLIYDVDGTRDPTQFLMSSIPVEGQQDYGGRGYMSFFARETRFNIDVRRTTGKVPLKLFIEGDFWSSGDAFRLRHAYVVAGDFIVGQTWTTLSILESLPIMIDFAAGDALFGGRTAQVRYQKKITDQLRFAVAIENIPFLGIENSNNLPGKPIYQLPLIPVRLDYSWKTGLLVVGASVGMLGWNGGQGGPKPNALQTSLVVAGRQYLSKATFVTWNLSFGQAAGENIMAFAGSKANAVLTADGDLEGIPSFAAVLGAKHSWNDKLASNFSYAYGWLQVPASRDPFALQKGGIGHLNLVYSPLDYFSTGIEYMWGIQKVTNDALGRASRLQMMVKFMF
ncbi:DcaP family trimeric outer membrane transporter [Flavihumibacter fluvii]|uniref:DcaP family trimeric outer membrane transporter n=1 Tax=Flavihumibacter fluvii TaxID=2838157 RepID=UPI001BDEB87F|nr:DcaP family trimeric outer membrane transporter [Flavihumibacter fluvii]ULQ51161.1 DcaP family trimeric outer membrane transporter [Flavihumibacter fluvii]